MSKKSAPQELSVLMAAYDDRRIAENQWGAFEAMIRSKEIDVSDAAVIECIGGKVGIVHQMHHPVRKGAVIGGVLTLLGPAGIAAGAVAGALGGKAVDVLRPGLGNKTIEDLGRFVQENQLMIVLTGHHDVLAALASTMPEATKTIIDVVAPDADAVHDAVTPPES